MSKDDLIKNVSNVMIKTEENTVDHMLSLIYKEEEVEGLIQFVSMQFLVNISFIVQSCP